jgi:hypothetical protein
MKIKIVSIAIFIIFLFGCDETNDKVSSYGTVMHMDLEGGFYGIISDSGDHFLPENLTSDFHKDSVRIYFEGIITDRPTTYMWGRTITLTKIERVP